MDPQVTAFVVAGVAGTVAASLAESWKVLTGKKPSPASLRSLVLVLIVGIVGGFSYLQLRAGVSIDWGVFGAQVLAAWAAALATHDVFSPRRKRRELPPPS